MHAGAGFGPVALARRWLADDGHVSTGTNWQAFFIDPAGFNGMTMTNGVEMVIR